MSLGIILLVVLILILIGIIPTWPHSRNWGYAPSGGVGLVVYRHHRAAVARADLTGFSRSTLDGVADQDMEMTTKKTWILIETTFNG